MSTPTVSEKLNLQDGYQQFMAGRYKEADRKTSYFVYGFFVFGILLAFYYDTWVFALGVGGSCLAAYLLCYLLIPGTLLSRMVTSLVFAIYMLQFIGQMHGMYEMHFFFFINIAILIIYQDWRIMVPYTLFAVLHHAFLFGVQMNGYQVGQYFINLSTISYTVLFFHLSLAAFMGVICGWWSIVLQKRTAEDFKNKASLELQLSSMDKNIAFAGEITQGNLLADYQLYEGDRLGESLLNMRNSLLQAAKKEDQERFKNVGLSEIAELLRKHSDNLQEMSYQVIAKIVKYMQINQGGLFILTQEGEEQYLDLIACYAFNRQKFLKKRIEIGEGLAGTAALEKDTIFITDVPSEYISITSGLGSANPRCILILPLKTSDDTVVGVMEFASFHVLQPHEIQFLEKLAENIASAITTANVNQRTKLLLEKSQQQAEELRAQEEEMRQNMEELEATQEEMRRKEIEMRGQVTAIDNTMATVEFDMNGYVRTANYGFLKLMEYAFEEIKGKHHRMFCEKAYARSEEYASFWHQLQQGNTFHDEFRRIGKGGKEVWIRATYTPVLDDRGSPYKVIKLAFDITEEKHKSLDIQAQIEAINNSNAIIEFTPQGNIIRANWIFQDLFKYSPEEMIGKHHRLFISPEEAASNDYQQHWQKLSDGETFQGEFKRLDKEGNTIWIKGTYNPVYDLDGRVMKIIKVAQDITAEKILEQHLQQTRRKVQKNHKTQNELSCYLQALDTAALMCEADIYGNITQVNERFCEVAQYTAEEVIGKPHSILRHPDNPKELFKEMWATIKAGKIFQSRYPNKAKDGSTYWVDATIVPVLGEDGKPVKYLGLCFEVTQEGAEKVAMEVHQLVNQE